MSRYSQISVIIACLLITGTGYVHGKWTGRWQRNEALAEAAALVGHVPTVIGEWEMVVENPVTAEEIKTAELSGYLSRQYRHRASGEQINFLLMCGKPGPISVHPPTACYTGLGYQQVGANRQYRCELTGRNDQLVKHHFQTAQFASPRRGDTIQPRIYWAWSTDGHWQSPENPRLSFVGQPALFKLYVAYETDAGTVELGASPAEEFLKCVIPEFNKLLGSVSHDRQ